MRAWRLGVPTVPGQRPSFGAQARLPLAFPPDRKALRSRMTIPDEASATAIDGSVRRARFALAD
jgi:hypothetical protein